MSEEKKRSELPKHWKTNSWEEKARENPLFAVMTTADMADADPVEFSPQHLQLFFEKGRRLAERFVTAWLPRVPEQGLVVEYGCGAGRILNALVERGIVCAGIDISPTMLRHCARLVPGVHSLHPLDEAGRCSLPDGCARLVFSHAVLQHIDSLSIYEGALSEMCRLLMTGASLIVQLNCEDYALKSGDQLGTTDNFEQYSVHKPSFGGESYVHRHSTWSGVYIGRERLARTLLASGVHILEVQSFNPDKPRSILIHAWKPAAAVDGNGDPVSTGRT